MASVLNRNLITLLFLIGSISLANAHSGAPPQSAGNPGTSGWTFVQDSPVIFCGQIGSVNRCTIGAAQIAPTQAGSIWVIQVMTPNNVTIASVTGGGGTWFPCPKCHSFNPASFSIDAWYNLTGTAGTTQGITINLSGPSGAFFNINFYEVMPPPGTTASLDDSGNAIGTNCTSCTGVQLNNISGTDVIIENPGGASKAAWNASTAPYVTTTNGSAIALNTTSGAAPTLTYAGPSNPVLMAIAFKSSLGIFIPPVSQYSIVQFTATPSGGQNCNPNCTINLPQATGAGHLLFLMNANLSNKQIASVNGGGNWTIPTGANTCQINTINSSPSQNDTFSCAYVLSSVSGTTSLSISLNGNSSTGFGVWEVATTSGSFALDTMASHANSSPAPSYPGQSLTLSGSNDVIFQGGFVPGGASGVSAYPQTYIPHQSGYITFNEASEAVLLNSGPTPLTPVWIDPQSNRNNSLFGVAFMAVGGSTTPNPPTGLTIVVQ